jgi:iron transport multicopper oxidase
MAMRGKLICNRNGVGPGVNRKQGVANNGKVYCSTLEQVVAKFAVDPTTGSLTQKDYFEPYNFDTQLNGGDRDFASAGVALLDRSVFSAPNAGVNGIAVASGKNGIVSIFRPDLSPVLLINHLLLGVYYGC